jgi:acyl-coenzyme A thioesterase PaaI-like protein
MMSLLSDTAYLRLFGFLKIPLLWFIKPEVISLSEEECIIKIPFVRKNKNHLGSIYFGVMCAAADAAGGFLAMKLIDQSGKKVALSFKDFNAKFLRRAHGDCYFKNTDGLKVKELVQKAIETGERVEMPVHVVATVPSESEEPVAEFVLTLSLKDKTKRG